MKKITIIGVPLDLGAGRRGVDMGPSALRIAGISKRISEMGYQVEDRGNIDVPIIQEEISDPNTKLRYLEEISTVNEKLAQEVRSAREAGSLPVVLGGDHSIAIGSIAGAASNDRLGVIWIDAHGDFNTDETTPSGNIHGMPLAASVGLGNDKLVKCGGFSPKISPKDIVLIGIRQLDDPEREALKREGVKVFSIAKVDELGVKEVIHQTLEYLEAQKVDRIHLSFDMDALCPIEAPGVGTPVKGGLTYREAHLAMELLSQSNKISSIDLVEVNPTLDEKNKTAQLAVELVLSALGKEIF